jgi:glucokinase
MSQPRVVVGVDLGGTNVRAAVIEQESGIIVARSANVPSRARDGVEITAHQCIEAIRQSLQNGNIALEDVAGVGMAVPGHVHPADGMVLWAPNFRDQWRGVPLGKLVSQGMGTKVLIGNDANLAALGEWRYGAGRGSRHLVMLTLGTGIGGGVIIDGRLLLGSDGGAAELGHIVICSSSEARGGNASFGTLEGMAQRDAIIERAARKLALGRKSVLSDVVEFNRHDLTPAMIADAANMGDGVAIEVLEETGYYIGLGVCNVINIFNPEVVAIGGGISQAGPKLFDPIRRTAKVNAVTTLHSKCRIVVSELGDNAGVMGGAALLQHGA